MHLPMVRYIAIFQWVFMCNLTRRFLLILADDGALLAKIRKVKILRNEKREG